MQFLIDLALSLIYLAGFLLMCAWAWRFWKMYVNQKFLNELNADFILLEIKLPREIFKSPLAAEIAISSLLQTSGIGNWYYRQFKGALPHYASLEIASLEGVIHFYVRVKKTFRQLVEDNFYAQYPGIEIAQADDYTSRIRYHHLSTDVDCWGMTYVLGKPWNPTDPKTGKPHEKEEMKADFYPIKTYVDYGLDKDPKEEHKIDPITTLLEFMGSVGKGEYLWYQIILQDESVYDDKKFSKFYINPLDHKHMSLSDMANEFKKQVRGGFKPKDTQAMDQYGYPVKKKDAEGKEYDVTYQADTPTLAKDTEISMEQKWMVEMANKKVSKPLVLSVIRFLYVAKKDVFSPQHIQKILSYPKPYTGANFLKGATFADPYGYPWQRMGGKRPAWRKEELFEAYVEREGFYPHIKSRYELDKFEDWFFWGSSMKARKMWRLLYEAIFHPFEHPHPEDVMTLNLEEVATLWHLPGAVATTPTLPRIDSAKSVAPVNLPR